jgi:hypothetical protein
MVKFPLAEGKNAPYSYSSGIRHSMTEARKLKRLQAIPALRKHLPEIVYHDRIHGILVMKYYPPFYVGDRFDALGRVLRKMVLSYGRVRMNDIHTGNVRTRAHDQSSDLIFVDLGY